MDQAKPPMSNFKKTIIVTIVLLAVVLIAVYFISTAFKNDNKVVVDDGQNRQAGQVDDGLPDEFFSYIGTITEIQEDGIMLNAEKAKNYLLEDAQIEVKVDETTEYQKTVIPRELVEGEEFDLKVIEMTFEDLVVGDEVIVISHENVKGKNSFIAKQVEVREAQ